MTVGYRFPLVRVHRTFVGKKTGLAGKRARKGCGRAGMGKSGEGSRGNQKWRGRQDAEERQ